MISPHGRLRRRRNDIPKRGSIWLVGDHYHGWMAFERKPGLDNDPEHQPSHVELHRQPRFHYAPGGAWYVKKFLDCVWDTQLSVAKSITLACAPNDRKMGSFFKRPAPFAPYTPTVSFTLDAYPRQPDGPAEDRVFRMKSHYGYHSTQDALNKDRRSIARFLELTSPGPETKACDAKLKKIATRETQYQQSADTYLKAFRALSTGTSPKLLIIDDMDMGFRDYKGFSAVAKKRSDWGSFLVTHFKNDSSSNHILVLLGRSLPDLFPVPKDRSVEGLPPVKQTAGLWRQLAKSNAQHTIIIVNADLLRFTGAPVSKRTSWEQTAEDCITALQDNVKFAPFGCFAHVIIRFGVTGAIHRYREGSSDKWTADLYYDSKAPGGLFRDVEEEGGIVGNNSVFASCVARRLLGSGGDGSAHKAIAAGIVDAIPGCQRFFRGGYRISADKAALGWLEGWSDPDPELFIEQPYKPSRHKGHAPTHSTLIDSVRINEKKGGGRWYIAADATAGKARLSLAYEIVRRGLTTALNNPSFKERRGIFAPIASFGNLKTIDRDEVEGFYSIANVIRQYRKVISIDPLAGPMSIAVFGPPGSGKSFTVREIIKSVDPEIERNFSEINMAQLSSAKELASHLLRVHDIISVGKTPLVFLDEFDCDFDNKPLGWLKYFLAPMEGGTFKHPEEGVFRLGRGIFVFAGGTRGNYKEFVVEEPRAKVNKIAQESFNKFKNAKAPDFLSRLRGHLNVKGINAAGEPGSNDDHLFPLRRAIILRSILQRTGLITEIDNIAQIDNSLLKALLVLREGKKKVFRYDIRSLKTVIDMCSRLHGRIEKASLPLEEELEMHVESKLLYQAMKDNPDLKNTSDDGSTKS